MGQNGRAFDFSHTGFGRFVIRLPGPGTRHAMQFSEQLPDEVPIADAVEQQRDAGAPVEESATDVPQSPPLEASPPDWQEQLQTVEVDPEERDGGVV